MENLLTPEEMNELLDKYWEIEPHFYNVVAKAQHKKTNEKWIEEIEKFSKDDCPVYAKCMLPCNSINILGERCIWWQSLKKRMEV